MFWICLKYLFQRGTIYHICTVTRSQQYLDNNVVISVNVLKSILPMAVFYRSTLCWKTTMGLLSIHCNLGFSSLQHLVSLLVLDMFYTLFLVSVVAGIHDFSTLKMCEEGVIWVVKDLLHLTENYKSAPGTALNLRSKFVISQEALRDSL